MTATVERQSYTEDVLELVERAVMSRLGRPKRLFKVDVKVLYDDRYRVNVWAEVDTPLDKQKGVYELNPPDLVQANKIIHSFFVVFNKTGFVKASPEIIKKYE